MLAASTTPANRRNTSAETSGQTCPLTVDQLAAQLGLILGNAGVGVSPAKVSRLVRTYKHRIEPMQVPFIAYVVNNVQMSMQQVRVVSGELARVISYADPTGETAVRNVLRAGAAQ